MSAVRNLPPPIMAVHRLLKAEQLYIVNLYETSYKALYIIEINLKSVLHFC